MNSSLQWLHIVPSFVYFVFFLVALVFVSMKRSDQSSAKTLVVLAVCMMLILYMARWGLNVMLAKTLDAESYVTYAGVLAVASSVFHVLAWSLLIAAAFVGRGTTDLVEPASPTRDPVSSRNPYSPPTNG